MSKKILLVGAATLLSASLALTGCGSRTATTSDLWNSTNDLPNWYSAGNWRDWQSGQQCRL